MRIYKYLIIISLFIILPVLNSFSQYYTDDEKFEISFIFGVCNSGILNVSSSYYTIIPGEGLKKIQARVKIKSVERRYDFFDPNKFSLIIEESKERYRPVDMQYLMIPFSYYPFGKLVNDSTYEGRNLYWFSYSKHVRDSFNNYTLESYDDIEVPVNYGSYRKPKSFIVYFDHKEIQRKTVDIYFLVPEKYSSASLYYGYDKISDFSIIKTGFRKKSE
jgi:hypothetical protein